MGRRAVGPLAALLALAGVGFGSGAMAGTLSPALVHAAFQPWRGVSSLPLLGGGAPVRLVARPSSDGSESIRLYGRGGRLLLSVARVGGMAVIERRGSPAVLIAVSAPADCGSAGCTYVAYAYRPSRHAYAPMRLPGALFPTASYGYRLAPRTGRWVPLGFAPTQEALGFSRLTGQGVWQVWDPVDDVGQHEVGVSLRLAPSGDALRWQVVGRPRFAPDAPVTRSRHATLAQVAALFLDAAALRLMRQAGSLTVSHRAAEHLEAMVAARVPWGTVLGVSGARTRKGLVWVTVYGEAGEGGPGTRMVVAHVTVAGSFTRAGWRVAALRWRQPHLRAATVRAALALLAGHLRRQARAGLAPIRVGVGVVGPGVWLVQNLASGQAWQIDALTGAVRSAGG
ncbi:MAG: hypothetical protein K6V73_06900 [Firmicutes bacterium]|nr:hypothetical protein [Bacillota bacterium]